MGEIKKGVATGRAISLPTVEHLHEVTRQHLHHQAAPGSTKQMSGSTKQITGSTKQITGSTSSTGSINNTDSTSSNRQRHKADEPPGAAAVHLPQLKVMPAHIVQASLGRKVSITSGPDRILRESMCQQDLPRERWTQALPPETGRWEAS